MSDFVQIENYGENQGEPVVQEAKSEATLLPTPLPRPSMLVVVMSLVVLLARAVVWGLLWQQAGQQDPNTGTGALLALVSLMPSWIAWQQWRGTFRQHERAANEAGNWLAGVGAILATCLAALPMMAATPLTLEWLSLFGGGCLGAAGCAYLNLKWARQLRHSGWAEEEHGSRSLGWRFSITDVIIWTLLAAGATASYREFDRLTARPRRETGQSSRTSLP